MNRIIKLKQKVRKFIEGLSNPSWKDHPDFVWKFLIINGTYIDPEHGFRLKDTSGLDKVYFETGEQAILAAVAYLGGENLERIRIYKGVACKHLGRKPVEMNLIHKEHFDILFENAKCEFDNVLAVAAE